MIMHNNGLHVNCILAFIPDKFICTSGISKSIFHGTLAVKGLSKKKAL
jgi:hypothetical protein